MNTILDDIRARRKDICQRIAHAPRPAGSGDDAVTLVAVSKRQPAERLSAMLATGQRVFGENRVQEAVQHWQDKKPQYPDLRLHLIGPLQTNKAVDAVRFFDVIETLDRPKLARSLANAAMKEGRCPALYVQVNTGEEPQKAGVLPGDAPEFLANLRREFDLHPIGLMCIPPVGEEPAMHFALLHKIAQENGLDQLSMGMSSDFETAIRFGATSVRVGSALFGPRQTD